MSVSISILCRDGNYVANVGNQFWAIYGDWSEEIDDNFPVSKTIAQPEAALISLHNFFGSENVDGVSYENIDDAFLSADTWNSL